MVKSFVKTGDFARLVHDGHVEHGLKKGDVVYIAGHQAMPVESDPYLMRKIFIISKTNKGHVDTSGGFAVDGTSLKPIKGKLANELKATLKQDYGKED